MCIEVLVYVIVIVMFLCLGIYGFIKSNKSRRVYKCKNCGEFVRTENMTSNVCSICGAPLEDVTWETR